MIERAREYEIVQVRAREPRVGAKTAPMREPDVRRPDRRISVHSASFLALGPNNGGFSTIGFLGMHFIVIHS